MRPEGYPGDPSRGLLFTIKPQQEVYTQERKLTLGAELLRRFSQRCPASDPAALAERADGEPAEQPHNFEVPGATPLEVQVDWVTPGYFETVGIPHVAGRDFTLNDKQGAPPVALMVRRALGRAVSAATMCSARPGALLAQPAAYRRWSASSPERPVSTTCAVRRGPRCGSRSRARTTCKCRRCTCAQQSADLASVNAAIRREFDRVDKGFPIFNVKTLGVRIDESLAREAWMANIASEFGIVALTLAAIGLYGILRYWSSAARREIGVPAVSRSAPTRPRPSAPKSAFEALRLVAIRQRRRHGDGHLPARGGDASYLVNVSPISASILSGMRGRRC